MIYLFIVEHINNESDYTLTNVFETIELLILNTNFIENKNRVIDGLDKRGYYTVSNNIIINFEHNSINIKDTHPIMRSILKSKREYDIKQLLSI